MKIPRNGDRMMWDRTKKREIKASIGEIDKIKNSFSRNGYS